MVNLELLKKIQDLKESGQILELKDPNTGKLDDRLLSEVYHLYYNGYLHLPEYHETLGFGNYKYLKKSFIRRGWKTLSVKEVKQVYRKEIMGKTKQTNLEKYGSSSPFGSSEIRERIKQTNLERYGYENPGQSREIRERIKQTNLERYGSPSPFGSSDIKEKVKGTNLERYGVLYPLGSPEIQEKIRKTNLERYGVENPSQDPAIREKIKQTNLERYGHEYGFQSPEIQEKIKQTNLERYGHENPFRSPEIQEKIKQTNIERYGHENPFRSPEIQEKIKTINMEKYGFEHPNQNPEIRQKLSQRLKSDEVRDKFKSTNLERYGVENPSQDPAIREKMKQTNLERYGVENPSQDPAIREKMKQTNLERYGYEYATQSPEFKERVKQTNLERYGYEFATQSPEFKERVKQTNLERYGYEFATQSPEFKERVKQTRKSNDSRYAKLLDLVENDQDNVHEFVIGNYTNHSKVLRRYGVYVETLSTPEAAIREILERHNIEYLFRHRPKFMDGKELDFFIPNKNLAIEVNGLYWHSYPKKDKFYHQDKHLRCRSEGIQLLSFTEDQILEKLEIIESMILHKLGLTPYRVYAKNCTIRELNTQQAKDFFESNHLHGWAVGQICYALEYEGKIVHAMSFGNNRFKRSNHPELIRSASLRFHSVAGGFQRLLKYYKRSHGVDLVESYVDFNISNGQSYELASKNLKDVTDGDNLTPPDLWFVYRGKRYYRQKFMKHNLHKIFEDFPRRSEEGYKDITVREFIENRGVLEYYGAGNLKYLI